MGRGGALGLSGSKKYQWPCSGHVDQPSCMWNHRSGTIWIYDHSSQQPPRQVPAQRDRYHCPPKPGHPNGGEDSGWLKCWFVVFHIQLKYNYTSCKHVQHCEGDARRKRRPQKKRLMVRLRTRMMALTATMRMNLEIKKTIPMCEMWDTNWRALDDFGWRQKHKQLHMKHVPPVSNR